MVKRDGPASPVPKIKCSHPLFRAAAGKDVVAKARADHRVLAHQDRRLAAKLDADLLHLLRADMVGIDEERLRVVDLCGAHSTTPLKQNLDFGGGFGRFVGKCLEILGMFFGRRLGYV